MRFYNTFRPTPTTFAHNNITPIPVQHARKTINPITQNNTHPLQLLLLQLWAVFLRPSRAIHTVKTQPTFHEGIIIYPSTLNAPTDPFTPKRRAILTRPPTPWITTRNNQPETPKNRPPQHKPTAKLATATLNRVFAPKTYPILPWKVWQLFTRVS